MRLAGPKLVVDLSRVDNLRGVRDDGDAIVIGAMTTHDEVVRDPLVREHAPLLALTAETWPIRRSGTWAAEITSVDGDAFAGRAKVKLGPISLQYTGTGRFVSRNESTRRAVSEASGTASR